jgi:hypothetical protein
VDEEQVFVDQVVEHQHLDHLAATHHSQIRVTTLFQLGNGVGDIAT